MPRKPFRKNNSLPYHVTARANNREQFPVPLDRFWAVLTAECLVLTLVYDVEIHALLVMPNHIHMLVTTPEHDLGIVMNLLMSTVTRTINLISGRSGHLFGGPYHWSLIGDSRYFGHALKYVYRNPVRAKLCENVEDYSYSTLHGILGSSKLPFPIHFTRTGMEISLPVFEHATFLRWLNKPFPTESEDRIRMGLRGRLFQSLIDRKTRKPFESLNHLL